MSFHEYRRQALLCYKSDSLSSPHGFTTRLGGVSTGHFTSMNLRLHRGDDPEHVRKNYEILGEAIGFDPHQIVSAAQVHGDEIRLVTKADWGKGLDTPTDYEADGLITNVPGTALIVFSADCGTVLLEDPVTGAVGACHAGWRGTALGIAGKTVREMARQFGCKPENIRAALGPCIGGCCFETDGDVPEAMRRALGSEAEAAITKTGEKYHVDLKLLNTAFLEKAGILAEHIDVCPLCTACDPDTFWSYRRHGDQRGSLGAVIVAGEHS
jgi:YfiH family protein